MAHTGEQNSKESGQNSVTTDTASGPNAPAASTAISQGTQQATAMAAPSSHHLEQDDKEYNPSAEAMIDDIDDERTLEEEEALAGEQSTAVQDELDDLKRESEMPIEELLAYYQRMHEQEGAQEDEDDEEFEDEEDEDEDMEDEGEDEVRKGQSSVTGVKNDDHSAQQSDRQHLATSSQLNQPPSTTTTQTQVNPSLSNTHLSSPPKPSQTNLQQPQQPQQQQQQHILQHQRADLKDKPAQDTQTSVVDPVDSQRPQRSNLTQALQINQDQCRLNTHPLAARDRTINIECAEAPKASFRDNDAQSKTSSAIRHRHSMTEFLVDGGSASSSILKTFLDYDLDDSDDLDEDYSYTEDENVDDERDWRRVIHVGPEYQADVPEGLAEYEHDLPPYENQDTLVWRCNQEQTKEELIDYLKRASAISRRNDISISPASVPKISVQNMRLYRERMQDIDGNKSINLDELSHENAQNPSEFLRDVYMSQSRKRIRIDHELEQENAMDGMPFVDVATMADTATCNPNRDENSSSVSQETRPEVSTEEYFHSEEQLLHLLLRSNHNFDEAMRRRRLDPFKYYIAEPMSLWSQDECLGFEHGLRIYGKNFLLIRETKVPTRSRAEVVAFYYLWKKSERHDVYTTQYKLDRKRSLTHPGTTDYMDKFIEDNESALNASSTHTPTPTESTVEASQLSDMHHDVLMLSKCRDRESLPAVCCPSEDASKPRDDSQQDTNDGGGPRDGQVVLDGDSAI